MGLNIEQFKCLIADAIDHRTDPPELRTRAKYSFWIDIENKLMGCCWATDFHPGPTQKIVDTRIFDPNKGFTPAEWDSIAKLYAPYLLEDIPCLTK